MIGGDHLSGSSGYLSAAAMAHRNPRPHPPYEEIEEGAYSSRPRRGAEGREEQTYDFLPIHRPGNAKRSVG